MSSFASVYVEATHQDNICALKHQKRQKIKCKDTNLKKMKPYEAKLAIRTQFYKQNSSVESDSILVLTNISLMTNFSLSDWSIPPKSQILHWIFFSKIGLRWQNRLRLFMANTC